MTKKRYLNLNEFFFDGIEPGGDLPFLHKFSLEATDANALQKEEKTGRHGAHGFFIDTDFVHEDELNLKRRIPEFKDWYKDLDPKDLAEPPELPEYPDWYDPDHGWYDPDHGWYDPDHGWYDPDPEPDTEPEPKPEPKPEPPDGIPFPGRGIEDPYDVWKSPETWKRRGGGGGGG